MVNASATESTTLDIEGMEHHGTSWDEECGKIILWKAVSIAIHQKSNRPQIFSGSGALIPLPKGSGNKMFRLIKISTRAASRQSPLPCQFYARGQSFFRCKTPEIQCAGASHFSRCTSVHLHQTCCRSRPRRVARQHTFFHVCQSIFKTPFCLHPQALP